MTARDSVAGRSVRPLTAGRPTWPDITSRGAAASSAANAVRNGASSRTSSTDAWRIDAGELRDACRRPGRRCPGSA